MDDRDILRAAREFLERAESADSHNRKAWKDDVEFARLEKQWPDAIRKQREIEGRPCLTLNRLGTVIRQVVNDARQNRPAMTALPNDSKSDPETAEVITGLLRNIWQASDADVACDTAVDHATSGGFGYWRINLDYTASADPDDFENAGVELFEQDITIRRIMNPLAVYPDPDSTEADSSTWMECLVTDRLSEAKFKRKYPKAKVSSFDDAAWSDCGPAWKTDADCTVAEYWVREEVTVPVIGVQLGDSDSGPGDLIVMRLEEWEEQRADIEAAGGSAVTLPRPIKSHKVTQYVLTGVEILETNKWPGQYIPIVPVYGEEVVCEGKRYFRSLIASARDAQRQFNYWRTAATEMVALAPKAPFIGPKGAFKTDQAKWNTANNKSWSYIEFDGAVPPARQPAATMPAADVQLALNASDDIKAVTGIYDASLGARSNETSGRAIEARQREGDVSTFHFIDNLSRAIRHSGRIILDLIPKVYSTPRIVRILGEDGKLETRPVNQEYEAKSDKGEALVRIHDLRVGKYDLTVTSGPSYTTKRTEAASQMIELIRAYPDAAPVIGDLLAKNLDWPGADEIAKRLEKALPENLRDDQGGIPPELQQQIQQLATALQNAHSELEALRQDRGIDAAKVGIDRYKAETERMQAVAPAMTPQEIQLLVVQTLQQLLNGSDLPQGEGPNGPTGMLPEPEMMAA